MVKKILLKLHVVLLALALIAYCSESLFNVGFIREIDLVINGSVLLTGMSVFFFHFKSARFVKIYFLAYVMTTFMIILGLLFKGFLWMILVGFVLLPLLPNELEFQQDHIRLYNHSKGPMAVCCRFDVREVKMKIFEKHYASFNARGPIDFKKIKVVNQDSSVQIYYRRRSAKEQKIIIRK